MKKPLKGLSVLKLREPIPLPQRLRLLCAAKRVERVGSDAGGVQLRPHMPGAGQLRLHRYADRSDDVS